MFAKYLKRDITEDGTIFQVALDVTPEGDKLGDHFSKKGTVRRQSQSTHNGLIERTVLDPHLCASFGAFVKDGNWESIFLPWGNLFRMVF